MSECIFNKKALRKWLLQTANEMRPGWAPTRVDANSIINLEQSFKAKARKTIHRQPTLGKTMRL